MSILLKEDQELKEKYDLFVQHFEKEVLPGKVKLWMHEMDSFGYVFIEATVSARIIGLNVSIDLLHMPVNLVEIPTQEDIAKKVKLLADEVRNKYRQIFTDRQNLRQ